MAERHFLGDAAGRGGAGVLGVGVDDAAAQGASGCVRIEAVHQEIGGVEIDGQRTGIEARKIRIQRLARFQPRFQSQHRSDAVAVRGQGGERFGQQPAARVLILAGNAAGLDDHYARPKVVAERQHFADMLNARLLIFGGVEAAAQRTTRRRQFQIVVRRILRNSRRPVSDNWFGDRSPTAST